jgi:hypothetical protein
MRRSQFVRSSLAIEDSNERLRIPERVVHGMMIVLGPAQTNVPSNVGGHTFDHGA